MCIISMLPDTVLPPGMQPTCAQRHSFKFHTPQEAVEWPQRHPEALERLGAKPPGGVLLFVPPGCSKTLLGELRVSQQQGQQAGTTSIMAAAVEACRRSVKSLTTTARPTAAEAPLPPVLQGGRWLGRRAPTSWRSRARSCSPSTWARAKRPSRRCLPGAHPTSDG